MASTNDLVPKEALDELTKLDEKLSSSIGNLELMLDKTKNVNKELSSISISYRKLVDAISSYEKIQKQVNTETDNVKKTLTEQEKVKQKILAIESKETQELIKLRQQLASKNKELKNTVREELAASNSIEKMRANVAKLTEQWKNAEVGTKKFNELELKLKNATNQLKAYEKGVGDFRRNVGNYPEGMGMSGPLNQASNSLGFFDKRLKVAGPALKTFGQSLVGFFAIGSLTGVFKNATKNIIEFEAANSNLAAILGSNKDGIKDLTSEALRLGSITRYTASEVVSLEIELAKLGFTQKEILNSTEAVLRFSQATGAGLGEAASLAGASLRMFNASTKETEKYVASMAIGTSRSALSFSYLNTALSTVGPVANAFGFTIEDTVALLGKLADAGFDASSAATATRNILLNLADVNGTLAKELGGNVKTLPELSDALIKLRSRGIDLAGTLELTDKRSVAAFNAFMTTAEGLVTLREQVTGVEGELKKMAETMDNNVQGSMKGLESAWESFILSFMESTGPMKSFIDFLANGIRDIANDLAKEEDRQKKANAESVSRTKERMREFNIEGENIKRLTELYNKKVSEGMSSDDAEKASKEELIAHLKNSLEKEQKYYSDTQDEKLKIQEEYENKSFIKQALFLQKTNKQFEDAIYRQRVMMAGSFANIFQLESIIETVSETTLGNQTSTPAASEKQDKKFWETQQKNAKDMLEMMTDLEKGSDKWNNAVEKYNEASEKLKLWDFSKSTKNTEKDTKKQLDAEKKAYEDLLVYRIQSNADAQKRIADDNNNLFEERKAAIDSYVKFQKDSIIQSRDNQLSQEKLTKSQIILINEKANAELEKITYERFKMHADLQKQFDDAEQNSTEKRVREQLKTQEKLIRSRNLSVSTDESGALADLSGQYARGEIKHEEYEKRRADITVEYAKKRMDAEIKSIEESLEIIELSGEQKEQMNIKLEDARLKYTQFINNEIIKSDLDVVKRRERLYKALTDTIQDLFNEIISLSSTITDRQISNLDKLSDENQKWRDNETEKVEEMEQAGAMSKEKADAQKAYIDQQAEYREEAIEEKRKDILTRQARFEKAASVAQIGIDTGAAIARALKDFPWPFSLVVGGIVGAAGAVQLANVLATPLPHYADGTEYHKGGYAIVGDGGREEVAILPSGKAYITPDTPTLVNLPRGSEVIANTTNYLAKLAVLDHRGLENDRPLSINIENEKTASMLKYTNDGLTAIYKSVNRIGGNMTHNNSSRYNNIKMGTR